MVEPLRKKIAIIGSGISGLGAASLLHPFHDITLFEKNDYLGGHSRTVEINTAEGIVPVDTGFIVYNKRNYPLLTRLFDHLKVPVAQSDMSFGVSINKGWLEYGTQSLFNIFAQKKNLVRPAFWSMISDILTFNKQAASYLEKDLTVSLGDCLDELGMGPWFREYYLLAMGGAIWSTPASGMLDFPAATFIRFFENHGLLTVADHPQWYTVKGGSREYVKRLSQPFLDKVKLNTGVKSISRRSGGVTVEDTKGDTHHFDDVVFACHADQALAMITDANSEEKRILSAFAYQPNRAVLHSDLSFMPKNKEAWASWVYLADEQSGSGTGVSLSYWMNNLQPLPTKQTVIVTLNPGHEPDPALVYDDHHFEHPVFDAAAIRSQSEITTLQGQNHLWFCGAYQRYGFHEDGLLSAVTMAGKMGIDPPW